MRIVSGHQPVYLPWLGLFHKLSLCNTFVYMDTVQYLKGDWNNRNKIRTPHGDLLLTAPVDKKRSGVMLDEIYLKPGNLDSNEFWQNEHFITIENNYKNTPFFSRYIDDLHMIYKKRSWERLVDICWAQFELVRSYLGLSDKKVVRMSEFEFSGAKDDLVLDHCIKLNGDHVVFGAHGKDYVNLDKFRSAGIGVYFQDYKHPCYTQKYKPFKPYMTVWDLLFNHGDYSAEIIQRGNVSFNDLWSTKDLWQ